MTLLELLVKELPKLGGWPEGANKLKFSTMKRIVDDFDNEYFHLPSIDRLEASEMIVFVTREQYESALSASKNEWDGVGLPPVGCEFEFKAGNEWVYGTCLYSGSSILVYEAVNGNEHHLTIGLPCGYKFRPIRSEADKKRDEAINAMRKCLGHASGLIEVSNIYTSIAAGKIPGVKLED